MSTFGRWFIPAIKGIFTVKAKVDYKSVPILINNYNRFDKLLTLIDGLTGRGYNNIWIIDNGSTYPPLVEWYKTCPYKVLLLNENVGHLSIFKTGLYKAFYNSYYAYTDSDLEICPECPDDFMEKFISLFKRYPRVIKVGFSLKIDDLPDVFVHKHEVVEWESQFWRKEVESGVYDAPIDTTFAVYRPWFIGGIVNFKDKHLRVGPPYVMRHLPWYIDEKNLSDEDRYYLSTIATSTHWSEKSQKNIEGNV